MGTAVRGRRTPFNPFPLLQPVQQTREPRTFDVEGLPDCGLGAAPIGFDHDQHRILGRTDLHRRQRADEILEYCDLEPTQKIAEVPVQLREVGSLASARTALFLREYAGAVAPCYALASFQGNSIAHFLPSILTHTIHLDEICCH